MKATTTGAYTALQGNKTTSEAANKQTKEEITYTV